jgi:hypothetical protein
MRAYNERGCLPLGFSLDPILPQEVINDKVSSGGDSMVE